MLREQFNDTLKAAMKARDQKTVDAMRLIIARMKEVDIAARPKTAAGVSDVELHQMMQGMIKQRRESIALYQQGGRQDLVDKELVEIAVIERFLPKQLVGEELHTAISALIEELGATTIKDMGRVMAEAKARWAGEIDPTATSALIKAKLAG